MTNSWAFSVLATWTRKFFTYYILFSFKAMFLKGVPKDGLNATCL